MTIRCIIINLSTRYKDECRDESMILGGTGDKSLHELLMYCVLLLIGSLNTNQYIFTNLQKVLDI